MFIFTGYKKTGHKKFSLSSLTKFTYFINPKFWSLQLTTSGATSAPPSSERYIHHTKNSSSQRHTYVSPLNTRPSHIFLKFQQIPNSSYTSESRGVVARDVDEAADEGRPPDVCDKDADEHGRTEWTRLKAPNVYIYRL